MKSGLVALAILTPKTSSRPLMAFGSLTLARISGLLWLGVGCFLLIRGLLLDVRVESTVWIVVGGVTALAFGILKGLTVLRSMALRNLDRLSRLPQPAPLHRLFPGRTWLLILFFMGLGIALRFSPLPPVVRSTVLLAVGLALLIGGLYILRNLPLARPVQPPPSPSNPTETNRHGTPLQPR